MGRRRPWVSWRFLEQNGWVSWSPEHSGSPVLPDVFLKSHNAENPHPGPRASTHYPNHTDGRATQIGRPTSGQAFRPRSEDFGAWVGTSSLAFGARGTLGGGLPPPSLHTQRETTLLSLLGLPRVSGISLLMASVGRQSQRQRRVFRDGLGGLGGRRKTALQKPGCQRAEHRWSTGWPKKSPRVKECA